ncbi:MAG TPA: hypothetical protein VFX79_02945 [Candidatus Saccharimonadales bacterium]|nr:hypothetical protein [Candidatus Saccharimonadales bacterium]
MPDPSELDPSLSQQKQQFETVCERWGVDYGDTVFYYGGELARQQGGQDPLSELEVITNLGQIPTAMRPSPSSVQAVRDRRLYVDALPKVARSLLNDHVEAEGSLMDFLPDDPSEYPGQAPMRFSVEGARQPRENTDFVAENVDPRYPDAIAELSNDRGTREAIKEAIKLMKQGKSILGITYHAKDIIDTAIALKMDLDLFDEQGFTPEKTALGLSKAIAWGEYSVPNLGKVVMLDVVSTIADTTYLLLPKTEASRNVIEGVLPDVEVDRNNREAAEDNNKLLDEGNALVMWSPIGSTRGGGVSEGTARLMSHPNTYVMPLSLWRMGDEIKVRCLPPTKLKDASDVDPFMAYFAKDLSDLVPDQEFIYTPHQK